MSIVNLPTNPAHKGSRHAKPGEALKDNNFALCLLAIVLHRNGGQPLSFSQADMDMVAGLVVLEGRDELGNFLLGLGYPTEKQS